MVVMSYPSACTANIRQERTGAPSRSTVQAPHTPCSQPACAPVSSKRSRKQSSRLMRGSTSSACSCPLTKRSMRTGCLPLGRTISLCDGADHESGRGAPAVISRSMQVGERLYFGKRCPRQLAQSVVLNARTDQCLCESIKAQWHRRDRANAEREPPAYTLFINNDLRRSRRKREIAAPRIHLVKTHPRVFPDRKANTSQARRRRERRPHRPCEERTRGGFPGRIPLPIDQGRPGRNGDKRNPRGPVCA